MEEIKRKCLWCGKEAENSPRDICWDCIYIECYDFFYDKERNIAAQLGRLGGSKKSAKKKKASQLNGKLGGRPKKLANIVSIK